MARMKLGELCVRLNWQNLQYQIGKWLRQLAWDLRKGLSQRPPLSLRMRQFFLNLFLNATVGMTPVGKSAPCVSLSRLVSSGWSRRKRSTRLAHRFATHRLSRHPDKAYLRGSQCHRLLTTVMWSERSESCIIAVPKGVPRIRRARISLPRIGLRQPIRDC